MVATALRHRLRKGAVRAAQAFGEKLGEVVGLWSLSTPPTLAVWWQRMSACRQPERGSSERFGSTFTILGIAITSAMFATLFASTGCQPEPGGLCDGVFLAWSFDNHGLGPRNDVSEEPGLQVDILIRSDLAEGITATLTVLDQEANETRHNQIAIATTDGSLQFLGVSVPVGRVGFVAETDNGCREIRSSRTRNVLADDRVPVCEVGFNPEPLLVSGGPVRAFGATSDLDPILPQTQIELEVTTELPQMAVRLLALNLESSTSTISDSTTGADGRATVNLSLAPGRHAVRFLCSGGPTEVPLSSATFPLLVDVDPPDCQLIEPTTRVADADDVDGDLSNGVQVIAVGQTAAVDAIGLATEFSVNGSMQGAGVVGSAGQTTAVITVPTGAGESQDVEVVVIDGAGNACVASVSL